MNGGRRSPGSRWSVRLAGLLGALVVLYGALALAFGILLDPQRVSEWLEPRIEAAVNRDVELGGVRPAFFPGLGIDVAGLTLHNPPGFAGEPLARIERIRLQVALLPLLRGRIRVDELVVDGPRVRPAVDADGASNYRDLAPAPREPSARGPVEVRIRELRVTDGSVVYSAAPDSVRVAVRGVRATASLERAVDDGMAVDLEGGSEAVELAHPALGAPGLRLSGPVLRTRARVAPGGESLEVEGGELRVGGSTLRLSGRLDDLSAPVRTVDASLEGRDLELGELAVVLPDSVTARLPGVLDGSLDVELAARGPLGADTLPSLRGRVELAGVALTRSDGSSPLRDVGGRVELADDSVTVDELAGTLLGGPFTLSGTVALDSAMAIRGRVEARPDLGGLAAVAPLPEGVALAGRADLAADFSGGLRRPVRIYPDGELRLTGLRVGHPRLGVPVEVESARFGLAGTEASWTDVTVRLGDEAVVWSGSAEGAWSAGDEGGELPLIRSTVTGGRLTLDRILPPRGDPEMTYGRIAFAHLGGRTLDGRTPAEVAEAEGLARPPPLPVRALMEVRLDTLVAAPYRLADVRARLEAGARILQVPEATFRLFGGALRSTLRLGLGADPLQPFELTLSVDGVRAVDFLPRTTPLGRRVHGLFGLTLRAGGAVDELLLPGEASLGGDGSFTVRDGRLERTPLTAALSRALAIPALEAPRFRDWRSGFTLEGGRVRLDEGRLATDAGELRFGGAMGLDGALDLGLGLSVPAAELDSLALGRSGLASAVARRISGDALVRIGVRVEGTVMEPRLRPDASLAGGAIAGALESEVRERAGAVRDTAAARARAAADSAESRIREEGRLLEERARERADQARERLEDRARGLLRGLTRSRDTATAGAGGAEPIPPPDTGAAPDTSGGAGAAPTDPAAPDTAAPDTILPDPEEPDTAGSGSRPHAGPGAPSPPNEREPGRE